MTSKPDDGVQTRLSDAQWILKEQRASLERLRRYDEDPKVRKESSKGFLVYELFESRGMLRRLCDSLRTATVHGISDFLEQQRMLDEEVRNALLSGEASLFGELSQVFDPRRLLNHVTRFVEVARAKEPLTPTEEWADEARDLLLTRDKLQLILDGVRDVWPEKSPALEEALKLSRQVDQLIRPNLPAFALARSRLERYKARFNAAADGYWWWEKIEALPAPADFWPRVVKALYTSGRSAAGEVRRSLRGVMVLSQEGTKLVRLARDTLAEAIAYQGELAESYVTTTTRPRIQVTVVDRGGHVRGKLSASIRFGPVIKEGKLRLRVVVGGKLYSGAQAIARLHLPLAGDMVMLARVSDGEMLFEQRVESDRSCTIPPDAVDLAIIKPSRRATR